MIAVLFSRMFGAFQLQDRAARSEGNFWALMVSRRIGKETRAPWTDSTVQVLHRGDHQSHHILFDWRDM